MVNPFKRNAAQPRPALRPPPGLPAWKIETEPAPEWMAEEDSDWAAWEDSAQPDGPFEREHPRDS